MNAGQTNSKSEKSFRPALIMSEHTVLEYSISLGHLLVGFADASIPVALIVPSSCDVTSILSGSAEVIRHPALDLPLTGSLYTRGLCEQLSRFKPNVLHCLCESKSGLTKKLARQFNLPYVLSVNSLQQRWRNFVYQNQIHPLSLSSSHCAKIIVPANSIAENVSKLFTKYSERIEQINTGTFSEENCRCFSKPFRMPGIVIAHPSYKMDVVENLFGAIRHLSINGYEFMTVIIGNGRSEKQLRRLLAALGLLQTVTIVPRLKPWRSIVGAGDIFIQPTINTSFNPLLLEAMSVGQAVATCKGGVDDMIIEDRTALIFNPSDEHSIINCLQRFLDRREFARLIASGAQQYVRENHKVSDMVSSTLRTYHEAVQWYKG